MFSTKSGNNDIWTNNVRIYLEKNGYKTQRSIAKLLGVSRATVAKWDNDGSDLKASMLEKVADALGVPVQVFFSDTDYSDEIEKTSKGTDLIKRGIKAYKKNNQLTEDEKVAFIKGVIAFINSNPGENEGEEKKSNGTK